MEKELQPIPINKKAKIMATLILLGIIGIWILAFYAYFILPNEVPLHFGLSGEPTRYGDKSTFLILPATLSIVPIIFLFLAKYRFTLINKYPYLINLPAFFAYISKIEKERRGLFVNRYFETLLCLGVGLTFSLLVMELGIFWATIHDKLPVWFVPFSLSLPIWLTVPFLFFLRKIHLKLKNEVENASK
jgi:uncharacterized membrane protein